MALGTLLRLAGVSPSSSPVFIRGNFHSFIQSNHLVSALLRFRVLIRPNFLLLAPSALLSYYIVFKCFFSPKIDWILQTELCANFSLFFIQTLWRMILFRFLDDPFS